LDVFSETPRLVRERALTSAPVHYRCTVTR